MKKQIDKPKSYFYKRTPLRKYVVPQGTKAQICHVRGKWPDGRIGWQPHTTTEEKTYKSYGLADEAKNWLFQDEGSEYVIKVDPKHVIGRDKKTRVEAFKPSVEVPPVRSAMTNKKMKASQKAARQLKKELKEKKLQKQRESLQGSPPIPQLRPGGRMV